MKKIIACLLTLAMLVGVVPAVLAADTATAAAPASIKLLAIGEDFTRSAFDYLREVFAAEGYTDITLGYVYSERTTPEDYVAGIGNNKKYNYCKNTRDYWESTADEFTLLGAVKDKDWDYIVFQTTPIQSGQAGTYTAELNELIDTVEKNANNRDVKIGWHINWPYQTGIDSEAFKEKFSGGTRLGWSETGYQNGVDAEQFKSLYNGDPETMYQAILKATKEDILPNSKIDFLVPVGTAIMNVKSGYIKDLQRDADDLEVDGANLTELGKLIASYTWYSAVTNTKLSDLKFRDALMVHTSSADCKLIVEAVNNAVKEPCKVTQSAYQTEPAQYSVTVNGKTGKYLPGDTVTITTKAIASGGRAFLNWKAVKGGVSFADAKALTTTFKVPAQDVEVEAVYEPEDVPGVLKVGFGRADITPSESVPLAGYGNTRQRMSTGTHSEEDRITVTSIAVSDGENTNIIVTMDLLRTPTLWLAMVQQAVEEKLGVPAEHVVMSATHTHAAPDAGDEEPADTSWQGYALNKNTPYFTLWMNAVMQAIETSLQDLSEVEQTKTASHRVQGMNWIRHWRYSDGTMAGTNFQGSGGVVMGFPRDTDQELQLIRFVRADKKDVVMLNWQGHPLFAPETADSQARYKISADAPGVVRRYLEEQDPDCLVAYYSGAMGNVQTKSTMRSVRLKWKASNELYSYGEKLGEYALEAMKNMDVAQTGAVRSVRQQNAVFSRDYKFSIDVEQDAITIGDSIAFVTAGYEIFDQSALDVKNASPYETTFVLSVTQWHEYMPTWETTKYTLIPNGRDAYEVKPVQFNEVPGTAEDLTDGMIGLLDVLYMGEE